MEARGSCNSRQPLHQSSRPDYRSLYVLLEMTRGDVLRYKIAFALRRASQECRPGGYARRIAAKLLAKKAASKLTLLSVSECPAFWKRRSVQSLRRP